VYWMIKALNRGYPRNRIWPVSLGWRHPFIEESRSVN
jgi:hypothetical protein